MRVDGALDDGLKALVRLSAAVVRTRGSALDPFLVEALGKADAGEVEEALLQSYLFAGYPAALNALDRWRRISGVPSPPAGVDGWDEWGRRGEDVCRRVYGDAYPGLRSNIGRLSAELDRWMVTEGYGKVLGRAGLELWRRECCIVALLMALAAPRQLYSHLRGALRTGARPEVVEAVVDAVAALLPAEVVEEARSVWTDVKTRWERA